jgi:predicted transcriptional regulator of viral defense system
MKKKLGRLEAQLFAYVQMRKVQTLGTGDLTGPLRITVKQERELFSRLARAGMIAQARRGLYLVPDRLPLGGKWSPTDVLALNTLMKDANGTYQICGPNAFNHYGFDDQVPMRVYAYNNRLSAERSVGSVALTLIKVADERLGSIQKVKGPDGAVAVYSSRSRTLVDAVYDWSRFDSLPRAYEWIPEDLRSQRVTTTQLVKDTLEFGNQGTIRRMGVLLEREGVRPGLLDKLERSLRASTSLIPWIPSLPKRGKICRRWGVVINE